MSDKVAIISDDGKTCIIDGVVHNIFPVDACIEIWRLEAMATGAEALREKNRWLEAKLKTVRNDVLEEAAKVCDKIWEQDQGTAGSGSSAACALGVRALKEPT